MKSRTNYASAVCLSALLITLGGAHIPSGGLLAQPTTGAPAASSALDQLTGPIALYPDALVIHILTASRDYAAVLSFAGWLEKNSNLKGSELQDAAQKAGYSEALVALGLFPQVIQTMAQKADWTKALGQAVTTDEKAVADSIQRLRAQAQSLGNLKTTPEQVVIVTNTVVEKTVEQQVVVVTNTIVQIQPANPQVIYVPTYPQTVYVEQAPPPSSASVAGAAVVGFTVGAIVANNNHYYHHQEEYWEQREDYAKYHAANTQVNQNQRQANAQANQDQRQASSQERQGERQGNQDQRQSTAQGNQSQRQSGTPSAQAQAAASPSQRQSAGTTSQWGAGQTASRSSGMSSGASYQSGSATKAQSSRGSASMSSSRGGGRSGGRSGGGRGR